MTQKVSRSLSVFVLEMGSTLLFMVVNQIPNLYLKTIELNLIKRLNEYSNVQPVIYYIMYYIAIIVYSIIV